MWELFTITFLAASKRTANCKLRPKYSDYKGLMCRLPTLELDKKRKRIKVQCYRNKKILWNPN
ncbi:hypothetical protein DQM28_00460 [Leptospira mayottensis]|uniref:Uncharacterized protein n=1 Tax=Leptospira mayottensis TaxID=1137606 RepID=A0ABM7D8P1_9LEPT|nr:hypothetical protein DQM28_00460 [Leptospira mayottensis]